MAESDKRLPGILGGKMITVKEKRVPSSDGIHILKGKIFIPDGQIKGYLHIVHGMTEHIGRYESFMRLAAEQGYITFGYDNLGHGATADNEGELGFIAHRDGWKLLAKDVKVFSDSVKSEYGELPYYLMGHSMGSFIVRTSVSMFARPDKLIIMGTGGANPASGIGLAFTKLIKFFKGERYISKTVDKLAFGSYNSHFEGEGASAWLSKDTENHRHYAADKYCTFKFSVSAMQDLITLNRYANSKKCFENTPDIPILLVSGSEDPVGDYGEGVKEVYNALKATGHNVKLKLYSSYRHEILNDFCRECVEKDIFAFLSE